MTDTDLDRCYSALAQALLQSGPDQASLLLAMVSLGMIAHAGSAADVLPLIEQARSQLAEAAEHEGRSSTEPHRPIPIPVAFGDDPT